MAGGDVPSKAWNVFARELNNILIARGCRIGQLDDRAGVHREKVRRLQRSLDVPKSFPTLNPDEMDLVIEAFGLTPEDVLRLHAAILATAVEALLMDRVDSQTALYIADQVLPILVTALQSRSHGQTILGSLIRGEAIIMKEDIGRSEDCYNWPPSMLLDKLDRATLAYHLSRSALSLSERLDQAKIAREKYEEVVQEIEAVNDQIKNCERWRVWFEEASKGAERARKRECELGFGR